MVITAQTLYSATAASAKEFAILLALGIPRWRISMMVLQQSFWVGVLGVVLAYPICAGLRELAKPGQELLVCSSFSKNFGLYGERVGQDEFGNIYYRTKGGKIDPTLKFERRWVIYNGVAEASAVPPSWHGWLHHTFDLPPTQERIVARPWWKPHRPNLTGTPGAHRPTGSTLAQGRRPKATGHYKAWRPGIGGR